MKNGTSPGRNRAAARENLLDFRQGRDKLAEYLAKHESRGTQAKFTEKAWNNLKDAAHKAAMIHAKRNRADRFAYARAMTAMRNGIFLPSEVASINLSI